jgi:plasmid stability protein
MTTMLAAAPDLTEVAGLDFHRTVDRRLLHRSALSEVFLTDCRRVDEHRYVAAAQLPPLHAYYTDHSHHIPLVDPLLLLECVRQAETYGGHEVVGVPADTKFILRDWSLHLASPDALVRPAGPAELGMVVTTSGARRVGGALRALVYETELVLAGRPVGRTRISVGYLSAGSYALLRHGRRGSQPPSSTDLVPQVGGVPVPPHRVGRANPDNVLLRDVRATEDGLAARIRAAVDHPSMFDHAQDHLPGMVMTEAARQAGLLALDELYGRSPAHWVMTGMDASFSAYAELDATTTVRVKPALTSGRPDVFELIAEFEQDGTVIADAVLSFAEIGRP